MLRKIELKAVYRTEDDNLLTDFYIPALSVATSYKRAVGFFSASMLSIAAQGISALVDNDGSMQLVVGGELSHDDAGAIEEGYDNLKLSEKLGIQMVSVIDSVADALCHKRLEALSWLIASGHLEIKIALRRQGMYHEKIGIIEDANGDAIVFQGSANETTQALLPDFNFESINVFPCWNEGLRPHFEPYLRGFDRLWTNKTRNTLVLEFPEAAKHRLIKIASTCKFPSPNNEIAIALAAIDNRMGDSVAEVPTKPELFKGEPFSIRPHQTQALNVWKANDFRGILAHATGSGKTITAVYGATQVFRAMKRLALVISVPYVNLADQWCETLREFRIRAIQCYGGKSYWKQQLTEEVGLFASRASAFLCAVVVNRTLQTSEFQEQLKQLPEDCLMWVGDECHHHSSEKMSQVLPNKAKMRLGLSATPDHYINTRSNERLERYYGPTVSTFTLEDALDAKVITPYRYHVEPVELSASEHEEYLELSQQISKLSAQVESDGDSANDTLKALLMKRARLLGTASGKIERLREIVSERGPEPLSLFYCGDGSTEDEDSGDSVRQVELVSQLLADHGWKCSRFTARESRADRQCVLDLFRIQAIDGLVAIRCLDEGIDVPACRTAYLLASARNPRQYIQRRGRILRRAPGKGYATIIDFVVHVPLSNSLDERIERKLIKAELERVAEFASLAINSVDATSKLLPILREYDLVHALT